jgi:hypothetical protein
MLRQPSSREPKTRWFDRALADNQYSRKNDRPQCVSHAIELRSRECCYREADCSNRATAAVRDGNYLEI